MSLSIFLKSIAKELRLVYEGFIYHSKDAFAWFLILQILLLTPRRTGFTCNFLLGGRYVFILLNVYSKILN